MTRTPWADCGDCGSSYTVLYPTRDGLPLVCEDCGATVVVGRPATRSQVGP